MTRETSNAFVVSVQAVGARSFSVEYAFPTDDADGTANFPKTNRGNRANAWHSTFKFGDFLIEWGDDNHSIYGWNSLRRIHLSDRSAYADAFLTDWLYPGTSVSDQPVPSDYNAIKGVPHYNNHVELLHPTEGWWFKFFNGGRYDLTQQPAVLTHRPPHQADGAIPIGYISDYWSGPTPNDWIRDDVGAWWGADATNAIYNPFYDYSPDHDCWLLTGGGAGSDTAYDGSWIVERNPNYPATQPEPWRIRNFPLTGKTEAGYVPRYQCRNHARFRTGTEWMYIFGGRNQQIQRNNTPSAGITEFELNWSNKAQRISCLTGEVQALPDMPMRMADGAVAYDAVHDVFVIVGIPRSKAPFFTRSGSMTEAAKIGFELVPGSDPEIWTDDLPGNENHVVIFDPQDNTYHDVSPVPFLNSAHILGAVRHSDGKIYFRFGSSIYPPPPNNGSQNWKYSYYWTLKVLAA